MATQAQSRRISQAGLWQCTRRAAVNQGGAVVTWGVQQNGGDSSDVSASLASGVVELYSNDRAFAALKTDGALVAWGDATSGGDSSAVAASLTSDVVAVVSTTEAFAALKADGFVVTWGLWSSGGDSSSVEGMRCVRGIASSEDAFVAVHQCTSSPTAKPSTAPSSVDLTAHPTGSPLACR